MGKQDRLSIGDRPKDWPEFQKINKLKQSGQNLKMFNGDIALEQVVVLTQKLTIF